MKANDSRGERSRQPGKRNSMSSISAVSRRKVKLPERRRIANGLVAYLMMELDVSRMSSMKEEFYLLDNAVSFLQFSRIMIAFLPFDIGAQASENILLANLSDLFKEIDAVGDGLISWEEFVDYIVSESIVPDKVKHAGWKNFRISDLRDATLHKGILGVRYIPEYDHFVLWERGGEVRVYTPETCRLVFAVKTEGLVLDVTFMSNKYGLSILLEGKKIVYVNCESRTILNHVDFEYESSPRIFVWSAEMDRLLVGCADGALHIASDTYRIEDTHQVTKHSITCILPVPSLRTIFVGTNDEEYPLYSYNYVCSIDEESKETRIDSMSLTYRYKDSEQELGGGVLSLCFDEDNACVIVGGKARVWLACSLKLKRISCFEGHVGVLCGIQSVHSNPPCVVSADALGYVRFWDVRSQTVLQVLKVNGTARLSCMEVVPSLKRVIVCREKKIFFLDYSSDTNWSLTDELPCFKALYNDLAHSILTCHALSLKVWNAASGKLEKSYPNPTRYEYTAVCLNDRKRRVYVGNSEGQVSVISYEHGKLLTSLVSHKTAVTCIIFLQSNAQIVTGCRDGEIIVHGESAEAGFLVSRSRSHETDVSCLAATDAHGIYVSAASDGTLAFYGTDNHKVLSRIRLPRSHAAAMCFCGSFPMLVVSDAANCLLLFGVHPYPQAYQCIVICPLARSSIGMCLCFDEQGQNLWVGHESGHVAKYALGQALLRCNMFPFRNVEGYEQSLRRLILPTTPRNELTRLELKTHDRHLPPMRLSQRDISVVMEFKAHDDWIGSIAMTGTPAGVLTASFDCTVKFFQPDGSMQGSLQQGNAGVWNFSLDKSQIEKLDGEYMEKLVKTLEQQESEGGGATGPSKNFQQTPRRRGTSSLISLDSSNSLTSFDPNMIEKLRIEDHFGKSGLKLIPLSTQRTPGGGNKGAGSHSAVRYFPKKSSLAKKGVGSAASILKCENIGCQRLFDVGKGVWQTQGSGQMQFCSHSCRDDYVSRLKLLQRHGAMTDRRY